jgi:hypothetical protein
MARYLQARPEGVLAWLCVKPPSVERRLFEHLLGAPEAVALDVPALAANLCLPARAIAHALFALNRHSSVAVQDSAEPFAMAANPQMHTPWRRGMADLEQDLIAISQASGQMLLACDDGFCIAQAGLSPARAQSLAAQLPLGKSAAPNFQAALCLGDRRLHLHASPDIDLKHPLMLRLGARLLRICHRSPATTEN